MVEQHHVRRDGVEGSCCRHDAHRRRRLHDRLERLDLGVELLGQLHELGRRPCRSDELVEALEAQPALFSPWVPTEDGTELDGVAIVAELRVGGEDADGRLEVGEAVHLAVVEVQDARVVGERVEDLLGLGVAAEECRRIINVVRHEVVLADDMERILGHNIRLFGHDQLGDDEHRRAVGLILVGAVGEAEARRTHLRDGCGARGVDDLHPAEVCDALLDDLGIAEAHHARCGVHGARQVEHDEAGASGA